MAFNFKRGSHLGLRCLSVALDQRPKEKDTNMASQGMAGVRFTPLNMRELSTAEAQAFRDLIAIVRHERLPE
jgi:hypothetical protein